MSIGFSGLNIASGLPRIVCEYTARASTGASYTFSWRRCLSGCIKNIEICHPQHNDREYLFSVVDDEGNAENISGVSEITWAVSKGPSSPAILTKTFTGGGISISGSDKFYFTVSASDSAGMQVGNLYHDCLIETGSGDKRTVFAGRFDHIDTLAGDS